MSRATCAASVCAVVLCAATAFGLPTPQQQCDSARIKAWKSYVSCIDAVVAKDAKTSSISLINFSDEFGRFAKCRRVYFRNWRAFQTNALVAGSTCVGERFTDRGDSTVLDNLSGLVWEKKVNLDGMQAPGDPHDADNLYTWSAGAPYKENGTVFTSFLASLNGSAFGNGNGWRVPTLAELQTLLADFPCAGQRQSLSCECGSLPCSDATLGPTLYRDFYWSTTEWIPSAPLPATDPTAAWYVYFNNATVAASSKASAHGHGVRAVRSGF
jgi:uncharacterized protein DUF1566